MCVFIKFTDVLDNVLESSTHFPGLGSGKCSVDKDNQFELLSFCALNRPSNASKISSILNAQTADPGIALTDVVKTA